LCLQQVIRLLSRKSVDKYLYLYLYALNLVVNKMKKQQTTTPD